MTTEKKTESERNALLTFLNSPFCIWIMSTIVLSGLSAAYIKYKEYDEHREKLDRVSAEINYRLWDMYFYINDTDLSGLGLLDQRIIKSYDKMNGKTTEGDVPYLYPEFDTIPFEALLFTRRNLLKDKVDKYRQSVVINRAYQLKLNVEIVRLYVKSEGEASIPKNTVSEIKAIVDELRKEME